MVTICFGTPGFDLSDAATGFSQGSFAFLEGIIPGAICLLLWRLHVTNKESARQNVSVLGLNEAPTDNQGADRQITTISPFSLLLCTITTIVTFTLGILAIIAYEFLRHITQTLLV